MGKFIYFAVCMTSNNEYLLQVSTGDKAFVHEVSFYEKEEGNYVETRQFS